MQRANRWRIRDEEEYTIALAYLRSSFDKSSSFWRNANNKDQSREALQYFDDVLPVDEEQFNRLNAWISDYLDDTQLKKLRVAMRVGKAQPAQGAVMATPMEYDTLREIYSSAMAALTRLEMQSGIDPAQFKEAENNFVQVWLNEVKRKDL